MSSIMIRESDQIMMSLVHYFVTKENYSPIHVQGVKDEIWLENLEGPYRIIRISSNSIINEEQYKFDMFKMENIIKQIKRKTLSFKVNALNICLDMDKKVDTNIPKNIDTIKVESLEEVKTNANIQKFFPDIATDLLESPDGLDLIINITNDINEKTEIENKKFERVFSAKRIVITKLLVAICLIMYLLTAIFSHNFLELDANVLAMFGANNIGFVKINFELWRLVTSSFLHAGLIHLIVNMYSLVVLGIQVETFIGKWKYLFIYFVSAIVGNLFSLVFLGDNIVSVGASGAIFGLMGALIYFGIHYRLYLNDVVRNQIIPIVLINLLIGFMTPGIDNAAHIGGLIGGYLAAMAIGIEGKSQKRDIINGWIVLLLLIGFLSYIIFFVK